MPPSLATGITESGGRAGPTALVRRSGSASTGKAVKRTLASSHSCEVTEFTSGKAQETSLLDKADRHRIPKRKTIYRDKKGRAVNGGKQSLPSAPAEPRTGTHVFSFSPGLPIQTEAALVF